MDAPKAQAYNLPTEQERLEKFFGQLDAVFPSLPNPYEPRMKVSPLLFDGVKLLTVDRYEDQRGVFSDHWHEIKHKEIFGDITFKQDSYVISNRGVIRGLHYQIPPYDQGKLVRCIRGSIQDVVVDLRKNSKTFGEWLQVRLDGDIRHQDMLWIPPGLAHGYCVLGDRADVLYKMTQVHDVNHERTLLWNDKDLDIPWEKTKVPILSDKDKKGTPFKQTDLFD